MSDPKQLIGTPAFENLVQANAVTDQIMKDNRRTQARGAALHARGENIDLIRKNQELSQEAQQLRDEKEALEGKLEAVSVLARTRFVDSEALRKTIVHLEKAWGTESPNSPALEKTSSDLDNVHREAYTEIWNDPATTKKFNDEVKRSQERQQAKRRSSPRR
jgi:hypothetical protein